MIDIFAAWRKLVARSPIGHSPLPGYMPAKITPAAPIPPRDWPDLAWRWRHWRELGNSIALWPRGLYDAPHATRSFRGETVHYVNAPRLVRQVLVEDAGHYHKPPAYRQALDSVLGPNLFTAEDEKWHAQRKLLRPSFQAARNVGHLPMMQAAARETAAAWATQPGVALDLQQEMMSLTLRIICRAFFAGHQEDRLQAIGLALSEHLEGQETRARRRHLLAELLFGRAPRRELPAHRHQRLANYVSGLLASGEGRGMLVEDITRGGSGVPADASTVASLMATILIGGFETTAAALTWTWYLLALHPAVAHAIREELAVAPADGLDGLDFTRAVVTESLRLYPPLPVIGRSAVVAQDLDGLAIAPGAVVITAPWLIQRQSSLWLRPGEFRPQRFQDRPAPTLEEGYLPFGAGRRACLGREFALNEMLCVLKVLVPRFQPELLQPDRVQPVARASLRARHGLLVRLHALRAD